MLDNEILKIDSTIRDSLNYYDSNREKYKDFFEKIKYIKFVNNNNLIDDIIFYDSNKKVLLESSYEILGVYLPKSETWKWSWAIPTIHKKYTYISRKILEYAFNLDHIKELPLRNSLINSKINIANDLQLDIHIALSSYVGKQPIIFKFYNKFDDEIENLNSNVKTSNKKDSEDDELYNYVSENKDFDENYMVMYLFILDYENLQV
jgi:hypothetical protein